MKTVCTGAINKALAEIIKDGRLEQIYDRWDMSGRAQMLSLRDTGTIDPAKRLSFGNCEADFSIIVRSRWCDGFFGVCIDAAGHRDWNSCSDRKIIRSRMASVDSCLLR